MKDFIEERTEKLVQELTEIQIGDSVYEKDKNNP